MRALFIVVALALCGCALAVAPRTLEENQFLFTKFIQAHGKQYDTLEEFNRRFRIFQANVDFVLNHNEQAKAGKYSFTLGVNRFADMTNQEYRSSMMGYRARHRVNAPLYKPTKQALPATVDWRNQNVVTGVKDQGQCGSCWAFSAVGSMEGAHALATKNLIALSEQELVDCANGGQDDCNTGGQMTDGFDWAIANGMESEADYPYTATSGNTCAFDSSKVVATFSSYTNVTSGSESDLQSSVANFPTVSVAIDASSIFFQLYSGGVYDDSTCQSGIGDLDHGVLVVGYGTYSGADYWLVKNSWGTSWGLSGYIMMSRNKNNQCGIATDASFPHV